MPSSVTRSVKKLKPKYGKLTVVSEDTIDGRRTAVVNCTCGAQKRVMVDALTGGRTRSCGARACKYSHRKLKVDKAFVPRGSRTVPPKVVQKIWSQVMHPDRPITIAKAAKARDIPVQTLYSVFRAVTKAGGIEKYMASVS